MPTVRLGAARERVLSCSQDACFPRKLDVQLHRDSLWWTAAVDLQYTGIQWGLAAYFHQIIVVCFSSYCTWVWDALHIMKNASDTVHFTSTLTYYLIPGYEPMTSTALTISKHDVQIDFALRFTFYVYLLGRVSCRHTYAVMEASFGGCSRLVLLMDGVTSVLRLV